MDIGLSIDDYSNGWVKHSSFPRFPPPLLTPLQPQHENTVHNTVNILCPYLDIWDPPGTTGATIDRQRVVAHVEHSIAIDHWMLTCDWPFLAVLSSHTQKRKESSHNPIQKLSYSLPGNDLTVRYMPHVQVSLYQHMHFLQCKMRFISSASVGQCVGCVYLCTCYTSTCESQLQFIQLYWLG